METSKLKIINKIQRIGINKNKIKQMEDLNVEDLINRYVSQELGSSNVALQMEISDLINANANE